MSPILPSALPRPRALAPPHARPLRGLPLRIALLPLVALLPAGCSGGKGAGNAIDPPLVGVVTVQPQRLELSTVLPGRTVAYRIAQVRPQVGGIIKRRLYAEGATVAAGAVLYEIDPATYQAAADAAQAALAKADANALSARARYDRYQKLAARGDVSEQDRDDVTAALRQAEADQGTARAALEAARINLDYTRVRAPIAGRTSTSAYTEGALVTANQADALTTVTQSDPMYVDFVQPAADVLRLRAQLAAGRLQKAGRDGAVVRLQLDDGSDYAEPGRLEFTGITVGDTTGTITLRAVFPNAGGRLLPGLYVRARLVQGVDERALLVPQQAVARDARGQPTVLVVDAAGTVHQRSVQVEEAGDNRWRVGSGLEPGARVVVEGLQQVRDGQVVRVEESAATAAGAAPGARAR